MEAGRRKSGAGAGKALIVWGGWAGHQPREVAEIFRRVLSEEGFEVEVSDSLDAFRDEQKLMGLSLIVPVWTMGKIEKEQLRPVLAAVKGGVGIAGCHGGMCDSFRNETEWQFMTGGQWVAHPGNDGVRYKVNIRKGATERRSDEATEGIGEREATERRKGADTATARDRDEATEGIEEITRGIEDFDVSSEQYYMHVDPAVRVLATTRFPTVDGPHAGNGPVDMPVVWAKLYGRGRVFYNSLGHQADIVEMPPVLELMRRGFRWAAKA